MMPLDDDSRKALLDALGSYPNGVIKMFDNMDGVVETSDNIGVIETKPDAVVLISEIRGGYKANIVGVLADVENLAGRLGAKTETFSEYAPWESYPNSRLQSLALSTYEEMFGEKMIPIVVHAGLECGFFSEAMPNLDIISLGPNCENFHSPQERLSVSSAFKIYDFLVKLLSKL